MFDDEGLDITCCVVGEKKKLSLAYVNKKIAELRAVAAEKQQQQMLVPLENGESQFDFYGDDEEEEEKEEEEEDGEDWEEMPEAQLNARITEMTNDLTFKKNQAEVGPVKAVLKKFRDALKSDKHLTRAEVEKRKQESNDIKTLCTEYLREKKYSEFQYQMLSEIAAAEVTKKRLPKEIQALDKQLDKAKEARNTLVTSRAITNAANAIERREKRDARTAAVSSSAPTSAKKRARRT